MKDLTKGISGSAELTVSPSELAVTVGSGSLEVFATPCMVALMEKSACACIAGYLENDETTVGTEISIKHLSATPCGMKVTATATLTEINSRELTFEVKASDECGLIGEGIHKRFIVYGEKFMCKAKAKIK